MILRQLVSRGLVPQLRGGISSVSSRKKLLVEMARPSSDLAEFRKVFSKAKHVVILTGAGVSAESGVPTFRGAGGYWRTWQAQDLATPVAFAEPVARVGGRALTVITQNIDELHRRAGSRHVMEIHGSLFKTRCTSCGNVAANHNSPICPALEGKGAPDPDTSDAQIPVEDLPRCEESGCNGLLRPNVVWFGETLDADILTQVERELETCDLCLVVGTSSIVYPAAIFAPQVAARGVPVAEFNMEDTPATMRFRFHFQGPCGTTLPPPWHATRRRSSEGSSPPNGEHLVHPNCHRLAGGALWSTSKNGFEAL
ncbi:hypothetical protein ANANG_G00076250 [Anguilla anguilla]|uniref:NAD-dependent protein deacylase sirtuin-5, mitochondrial n=1 Tax=Anguilla anguilla TaxID=7936 RepID=A0A9D3S4H0_ANGAN|nr:hypothetical protein ANANG_G00076250 [Anguilla anguilla]